MCQSDEIKTAEEISGPGDMAEIAAEIERENEDIRRAMEAAGIEGVTVAEMRRYAHELRRFWSVRERCFLGPEDLPFLSNPDEDIA